MVFAPPRASGDAPPAVHVETHTGQERRVVRGEEEDGSRHVARLAEPPERDGGDELPAELVREPVEAGRGLHEAGLGGDGVHRVDEKPALLTRMSRPPKPDLASSIIARTSAERETSARRKRAAPPSFAIVETTRRPFSSFTSATTTRAPSRAKRVAMASPNPDPAPVTIAILPSNRMSRSPPRRGCIPPQRARARRRSSTPSPSWFALRAAPASASAPARPRSAIAAVARRLNLPSRPVRGAATLHTPRTDGSTVSSTRRIRSGSTAWRRRSVPAASIAACVK